MLLNDVLIIDFSQFLSAPSAALRMADLGARVIKVERPEIGDICRSLYVSEVSLNNGESTIFHAINRNKESLTADIKNNAEKILLHQLIQKADVVLHNFRPGVMERVGLSYADLKIINPRIIYGEISGYGVGNDWSQLPGQDLLVQSVTGLAYASGTNEQPPVPMGVAVADILSGTHLVQGVLAALIQRGISGEGGHVSINMLESTLDFQSEGFTAFLNGGPQQPPRSGVTPGNPYVPAPHGIYKTADDCIAVAGGNLDRWASCFGERTCLDHIASANTTASKDEVHAVFSRFFLQRTTQDWLQLAEEYDLPCSPVWNYLQLTEDPGYQALQMEQWVGEGINAVRTTRCPVRINGQHLTSNRPAPNLGDHSHAIKNEFNETRT